MHDNVGEEAGCSGRIPRTVCQHRCKDCEEHAALQATVVLAHGAPLDLVGAPHAAIFTPVWHLIDFPACRDGDAQATSVPQDSLGLGGSVRGRRSMAPTDALR